MLFISTCGRNSMDSPALEFDPLSSSVALTAARHIFNFSCRPQAVPVQQVLKRLEQHRHPDLTRGSDYQGYFGERIALCFLILIYMHVVCITI